MVYEYDGRSPKVLTRLALAGCPRKGFVVLKLKLFQDRRWCLSYESRASQVSSVYCLDRLVTIGEPSERSRV